LEENWTLIDLKIRKHENEVEEKTIMAAVLQGGMLSHGEQTMASDDYPDWLTAEHRTGVSKGFPVCLQVFPV